MTDILSVLESERRPRLLMDAARIAARDYRRASHLARLLPEQPLPGSCQAFLKLCEMERGHEAARRAGDLTYRPSRHVAVMSALLGEALEIRRRRLPQAKASADSDFRLAV